MKRIVGFSGGIDSQACAAVVLDKFGHDDVILTNSDAGEHEDPLTAGFIAWYSAKIHPVVSCNAIIGDLWKAPDYLEIAREKDTKIGQNLRDIGYQNQNQNQKLTFAEMIKLKGRPPSRTNQFCTEILKLRPQKRWMAYAFGPTGPYAGESFCRYAGVRRDESETRKDTPDSMWDDFYDCEIFYPVAGWTKQSCFDFILARGEEINPLYMLGFSRVGCAPCINSSKEDILNWVIRRPAMIEKLRKMEAETGITFFPPMVPGTHHNTIDEVVAWAKTDHGGRQFKFPVAREACESKYGLCE